MKKEAMSLLGVVFLVKDEKPVVSDRRIKKNLRQKFDGLGGKTNRFNNADGLKPVSDSRFDLLSVKRRTPIRVFVESQGYEFATGKCFYQLTKPEMVQGNKELVIMKIDTGEIFHGPAVRELLGIPAQTTKNSPYRQDVRIAPKFFRGYLIFIQSTSNNRVLMPNTRLLYENEDWHLG